ncbi:MAG: hypothetical protein U0835_00595 [Isosphaeraceae bacterium]
MEKLGSNAAGYMARLGIEELRAANESRPVEAPTIEPPQEPAAPQPEAPAEQSYVQMIERQADQAQTQSPEQQGMSR